MSNEQWIEGGNCDICRRRNYCRTQCKQHKARVNRQVAGLVMQAMVKTCAELDTAKLKMNRDHE